MYKKEKLFFGIFYYIRTRLSSVIFFFLILGKILSFQNPVPNWISIES